MLEAQRLRAPDGSPVGVTKRQEHVKMLRSGAIGFVLLALTEHASDDEAPTRVSSSQYEDALVLAH